ncbi:hypothetical protein D7B24_006575 [Verticillium nonalfalfae]|uniref:Major facilitator superfamily (MFS) profile domain-containing protein n=1 Tax=Verticillium nonalfalfae TaxID=1051616 RepID=A0A3M9YCU1_9PEZI|nr:uncharacterized protein D7B24_006575 [Verticillium nonalfalfae]RNJ56930.1 hypothetical protein D7B24_006575 [Verticillium nonalfalfae]
MESPTSLKPIMSTDSESSDTASEAEPLPARPAASYVRPPMRPSTAPSEEISGSVFLISESGELLKLPIPSNSPRDPLAWTVKTRIAALVSVCIFSMTATVTLNLPTGMQIGLALEFPDETLKPLGARSLRSVMTFSAGMGYIIATPLSTAIGRRPVVLIASATVTLMTLWAAMAGNFYQLMAATCIQGISGGATFAVAILIIVDATFIHERPYAFAVFWAFGTFFVNCLHMALPFFLKPSVLWRPVYLAWCGGLLAVFIISYCFIPETYFIRPAVALNGRVLVQSSTEKVRIYDSWEAVPCGPDCPHNHDETPGPSDWALRRQIERAPGTQWESGLVVYAQMLLCMCNPLLVWVSLLSATILSGVIFTTLMLEEHFEHNLPRDEVRMSGVYRGAAAIIGSLLAIPASGPLISLSIRYFTLRNGGTRHAEVYLPGFVLPVLSSALCQVLLAMGSSSGGSAVLYYVSYGLCMFSYVSGEVAVVLWIIEAFPPWASASLAVQYFVRDMVAFGIGINLMAWVKKEVNVQSSLVILVLVLVIGALAVPIVFWGKTVRQYIHGKWSESTKGAIRPR